MKKTSKMLMVLSLSLTTLGCSSSSAKIDSPFDFSVLNGNKYMVQEVSGATYEPTNGLKRPTFSFREKDGKYLVYGNTSCNNYNGTIVENASNLITEKLMVTRKSCVTDQNKMELTILKMLRTGSDVILTPHKRQLDDGSGTVLFENEILLKSDSTTLKLIKL